MFQKLIASFLAMCELLFPAVSATPAAEVVKLNFEETAIYADESEVTTESSRIKLNEDASVIYIMEPGVYALTGNFDGSIVVDLSEYAKANDYKFAKDCPEATVQLILDNITINSNTGPAIMFSSVYECDTSLTAENMYPSVIKDLSHAGAIVTMAADSKNFISGAYQADGTTAAIISSSSMYIGADNDSASMNLQSGMNGISALGHLIVNGGTYQIFAENDGMTTDANDISSLSIYSGNLSVYTNSGDAIRSDGYAMVNGGSVFATAGGTWSYGMKSELGSIINGGMVVICGDDNSKPDNGDQAAIMLESSHPMNNVAVIDENGKIALMFDLTKDENYSGLEIGRTFDSIMLSNSSLVKGEEYTVWYNAVLNQAGEYKHGILQYPANYEVADGYPMKFKNVTVGTGASFASSYLSTVYDMATVLDRHNSMLDIGGMQDIDMKKLDEVVDITTQLDYASNLEEAATNAKAVIDSIDRSSLMGNELWHLMNQSIQAANQGASANFVLWDSATTFSDVFAQTASLRSMNLPDAQDVDPASALDVNPAIAPMTTNALDLPAENYDLPASNISSQSMYDLPADNMIHDLPAQATSSSYATMEVDGRTLFYDGHQAASYSNNNGFVVSGDVIDSKVENRNALRLWNDSKGVISNISISKTGDSSLDDITGTNATLYLANSTLYLTQSDLFSKAKNSDAAWILDGAELNLTNVTAWTNGDESDTLVTKNNSKVIGKRLIVSTSGNNSTPLNAVNGYIDIDSMDLNSVGKNSPLVIASGEVTLNFAVGGATQSAIAHISNYLQLDDSTLFSTNTSSEIPYAFLMKKSDDEASLLINSSTITANHEHGTMFMAQDSNAEISLYDTNLICNNNAILTAINSHVSLYGRVQKLTGDIIVDENSSVNVHLIDFSIFMGTTDGNVKMVLDETSTWELTSNCSVETLETSNLSNIMDTNGNPVTIVDANGDIIRRGSGEYVLIVSNLITSQASA